MPTHTDAQVLPESPALSEIRQERTLPGKPAHVSNNVAMLLDDISRRRRQHSWKERVARVAIRWLLACPLVFGVFALVFAFQGHIDKTIVTCIGMILTCTVGLIFDLPAIVRKHAVTNDGLASIEAELHERGSMSPEEARQFSAKLVNLTR
ncbi:hypothetical protein [Paludibacterium yongneupense]|uniref:hypothetical protein n=1 Tax=Paludibacterium yongneupense TaxID=400061 RepID=UPI0012EB9AA7|nr:hypothetical protein [Paludibacterium yongneupense]